MPIDLLVSSPALTWRSAVFAVLAAVFAVGCAGKPAPLLFEVDAPKATELEVGESFVLSGTGFPSAHPPHVHLKGRAERRGAGTVDIDVVVPARVVSASSLELKVGTEIEHALFEKTDTSHAAFDGTVEVGFATFQRDEEPIVLTIENVHLEIHRAEDAARLLAFSEEGKRELERFGVTASEDDEGALVVREVTAKSPAMDHGLVAGDIVASRGHLRIHDLADLVGESSDASLFVLRGDERIEVPAPRSDHAPKGAIVLLGLFLALLLAIAAPPILFRPIETRRFHFSSPHVGALLVSFSMAVATSMGGFAHVDLVMLGAVLFCLITGSRMLRRHIRVWCWETAILLVTLFFVSRVTATIRLEEIVTAARWDRPALFATPMAPVLALVMALRMGDKSSPLRALEEGIFITLPILLFVGMPHHGALGAAEVFGGSLALFVLRGFFGAPPRAWTALFAALAGLSSFFVATRVRQVAVVLLLLVAGYLVAAFLRFLARKTVLRGTDVEPNGLV